MFFCCFLKNIFLAKDRQKDTEFIIYTSVRDENKIGAEIQKFWVGGKLLGR